ncbi:MAG: hypothetical protein LBG82_06405, partial [Clostridiales Family XIII bacterium]|nr:hypothetical protein [Clostridiales Family XIII bacterium]
MADSFATDVKNEIAHADNAHACCVAAEIAGFVRACGSVTISASHGGLAGAGAKSTGMGLKLATENAAIARRYKSMISDKYGIDMRLMVGEAAAGRRSRVYILSAPAGAKTDAMLTETGAIYVSGGERRIASG